MKYKYSLPLVLAAASVGWANGQTFFITTVAGNGTYGYRGDGGPATAAGLTAGGVTADSSGNFYIPDYVANRVRKISAGNGIITTVAGNGRSGFHGDGGPATDAELGLEGGRLAVDAAGNLYIGDNGNHRVRKVTAGTGVITTVAGNGDAGFGGDGGPAIAAQVQSPTALAVDSKGNLYIAETEVYRVRKVEAGTGIITTVAGNGSRGYFGESVGDGGAAIDAPVHPDGIAVDAGGNLFIADERNKRIRKVAALTGVITTVAGNGITGYTGDGGVATRASLQTPFAVAVDLSGNLFIADEYNYAIRKVSVGSGIITTIAGNGKFGDVRDDGAATEASLQPTDVAVDLNGNVYVADDGHNRIRKLRPSADAAPTITSGGIGPVFSPSTTIQPGSWVSIYGTNFAAANAVWNGEFPTSLGGVSVTINNRPAYLWFVSPGQINLQVPDDFTAGPVPVAVTTANGTVSATVTLAPISPSFSLLGDGRHVAGVIATPNGGGAYGRGTYDMLGPGDGFDFHTRPVKAGENLVLYGVGFGPTNPAVPAGKAFSGAAPTTNIVSISIGGVPASVSFAGAVGAGFYQFNVTVPATGHGEQAVKATVNGISTPAGPVATVE